MMDAPRLFTSRWSNRDLGKLDAQMVAISRGVPHWPPGFRYRKLMDFAPTREEFGLPEDEFDRAYLSRMDSIGVQAILDALTAISDEAGGKPLVLLCWENVLKGEGCHRRLLAGFIEERAGIEVPELEWGMLSTVVDRPGQPRLW